MAILTAPCRIQYPQNLPARRPLVGFVSVFEDIEYGPGGPECLLAFLITAGVVLSIEGDRLAFDAPAGVLTDKLLDRMRGHREELLGLIERFEERAAVVEYEGEMSRAEAERRAWSCVLGDLIGSDPAPPAESPSDDPAPGGPSVPSSACCPWCRSIDLVEAIGGLRCVGCDRIAWADQPAGGWVRADDAGLIEVDPDVIPACPACGRLCDVDRGPGPWGDDVSPGAWACARCDPGAEARRRLSGRWSGCRDRLRV